MKALVEHKLDTKFGTFSVVLFGKPAGEKCLLIIHHPVGEVPFVRLHSACLFGESLHGTNCDCALQLDRSLEIASQTGGVIVYLFQEGRGLGLLGKMRAIEQEQAHNIDTAEAFRRIGAEPDPRTYEIVKKAFLYLKMPRRLRFATNNPLKIRAIERMGYEIHERVILTFERSAAVQSYVDMKTAVLGHYGAS